MRLLITLWCGAILLAGGLAGAFDQSSRPPECKKIEKRAYGFVKCSYHFSDEEWSLVYLPMAYGQVIASGKYSDMMRTLCDRGGDSIREEVREIFSKWTRTTKCRDL